MTGLIDALNAVPIELVTFALVAWIVWKFHKLESYLLAKK